MSRVVQRMQSRVSRVTGYGSQQLGRGKKKYSEKVKSNRKKAAESLKDWRRRLS